MSEYKPKKLEIFRLEIRQQQKQKKISTLRLIQQSSLIDYHQQPIIMKLDMLIGKIKLNKHQNIQQLMQQLVYIIHIAHQTPKDMLLIYNWASQIDLLNFISSININWSIKVYSTLNYEDVINQNKQNQQYCEIIRNLNNSLIDGLSIQYKNHLFQYFHNLIDVIQNNQKQSDSNHQIFSFLNSTVYMLAHSLKTSDISQSQALQNKVDSLIRSQIWQYMIYKLIPVTDSILQKIQIWLDLIGVLILRFKDKYKNNRKLQNKKSIKQSQYIELITQPTVSLLNKLNYPLLIYHLIAAQQQQILGRILANTPLKNIFSNSEIHLLEIILLFCDKLLKSQVKQQNIKIKQISLIFDIFNQHAFHSDSLCYITLRVIICDAYKQLLRCVTPNFSLNFQQKNNLIISSNTKQILKSIPKLLYNCLINQLIHNCNSDYYIIIEMILDDTPQYILNIIFNHQYYLKESQQLLAHLLNVKIKSLKSRLCEWCYNKWKLLEKQQIDVKIRKKIHMLCICMEIGDQGYLDYWQQNYQEISSSDEVDEQDDI